MKPNNPAVARTRHVWRAARQQSGVLVCYPARRFRNWRPARPSDGTHDTGEGPAPTVYQFCPHFANTFPGTSGKLRDIC